MSTAMTATATTTTTAADRRDTTDPLVHLGLVRDVANTFRGRSGSLTVEDLEQEGFLGLMRARESYDPDRGVKFGTYATYWVRCSIIYAIANRGSLIRVPINTRRLLGKHRRARAALSEDVARRVEQATEAQRAAVPVDPRTMAEPEKDGPTDGPDPEELDWLRRNLGRLTPAMRRALVLHYGLDGGEPINYPEVGRRCGISKQAAQDAARRGMRRLQKLKATETRR